MIVTSCRTMVSPGTVSSQLPPCSPARSTITDPGRIASTVSALTSIGARLARNERGGDDHVGLERVLVNRAPSRA